MAARGNQGDSADARTEMSELTERVASALADRYRVQREIGTGGMATVYLAEDLRHRRLVAVKVLRADLAASLGPDRFLREVTIAASLQHPHILPLYDSGQADSLLYYVMPFVEGTSLRQKLIREGELPIVDAIRILRDVADAMMYAHSHHVVHRDIKPENVMLTGRHALVADFGVAKAVSEATGAHTLTTAGVALGTPTYMAPEQATADPHLDHRADIYAWGVMAYELLAGRPPFLGTSAQAVLGAHLATEPEPVSRHRSSIPPVLASLVMRALEKRPADRWQSSAELVAALENVMTPSGGVTPAGTPPLSPEPGPAGLATVASAWLRRAAMPLGLLAAGLVTGFVVARGLVPGRSPAAPVRFTIPVVSPQLDAALGQLPLFAVSPTGGTLVYGDGGDLYLRELDSFSARKLERTAGAVAPAYSPDGQWLVFSQAGRIRKLAISGGQVVEVATANFRLGAAWSEDDFVYFSAGLGDRGIWRVPASGGASEQVTRLADSVREQAHGWPQLLPGGRDLLYSVIGPSGGADDSRIVVQTLGSGRRKTLVEKSAFARYVPTGHLLYADLGGSLFAIRYDPDRQEISGVPVPVLDQRLTTAVWGGRATFDVSPNGVLLFVPDTPSDHHLLQTVDAAGGTPRPIGRPRNMRGALVSPDGRTVASTVREPGRNDVWLLGLSGELEERLTLDQAEDEMPVWSPDGRRIAYSNAWAGEARRILVTDIAGRGEPEVLRAWSRHIHPSSWSPDGQWLAAYDYHPTNNEDVWVLNVRSTDSVAVATTEHSELNPVFSPDGRWIAYQSSESGQFEVYVTPFPSLSGKRQVSTDGGAFPRWDRSGQRLYFLRGRQVMAVGFTPGAEVAVVGQARTLYTAEAAPYEIDVLPGGQRHVLLIPNAARANPPLHVVSGWFPVLQAVMDRTERR